MRLAIPEASATTGFAGSRDSETRHLDAKTEPRLGRKEPNMPIIGLDYHPSFQQIAFMDDETGEFKLVNDNCCTRTAKPKGFIAN